MLASSFSVLQLVFLSDACPLFSFPRLQLSADDQKLIWDMRHHMTKYSTVLPKFLLCVKWGVPDHKFEVCFLSSIYFFRFLSCIFVSLRFIFIHHVLSRRFVC